MISNEKVVSRKEDKQMRRVAGKLVAVKSHLKCEIANINSKIESMSNSFVTSLINFNDELNNFNFLKDNLNFLQKELEEKNQIIKTLMEIQTAVLEFIANQNHNNSNRSSSTSHVNNNTTNDTKPIHESHSLKQQQYQHQTEERFSEKKSLPWGKVITKQRNNRNQSIEKTKLFVGNLNQSTTEKDLNELFGLECTLYLRETCSIEMPKKKKKTRDSQKISPS